MLQSLSTWLTLPVSSPTTKHSSATPSITAPACFSIAHCAPVSGASNWNASTGTTIRVRISSAPVLIIAASEEADAGPFFGLAPQRARQLGVGRQRAGFQLGRPAPQLEQ